jgi:hypothetical protein
LIPDPIAWRHVPETWWWLVKEISWLVFTESQLNFTPEVGQKVRVKNHCEIPMDWLEGR